MIFAVIPSLLGWTIVLLLIEGDVRGAIQIGCTAVACGYVGWALGDTR